MKTQILNIGKALSKAEQKNITGGRGHYTVGCSVGGGGDVNSVAEANALIRKCWANGGAATIRSND